MASPLIRGLSGGIINLYTSVVVIIASCIFIAQTVLYQIFIE
jgi:hypothetical protein